MGKNCKAKPVRVPSLSELEGMAPQLDRWLKGAAQTYGMYSGINKAIKQAKNESLHIHVHIDDIRSQLLLFSIIRIYAAIDRKSKISIQRVSEFLKVDKNAEELLSLSLRNGYSLGCKRFLDIYNEICFKSVSKMQSLRNAQSHIVTSEVRKKIKYGEVELLINQFCALSKELNLMTRGSNSNPGERIDMYEIESFNYWISVIRADLDIV